MTCRHSPGDPNCSSSAEYWRREQYTTTPDSFKFEIVSFEQIGKYLIIEVQYPNCTRCSYEGRKLLVYEGVKIPDIIFWKEIDPHFKDPTKHKSNKNKAPPPIARFPASAAGLGLARKLCRD